MAQLTPDIRAFLAEVRHGVFADLNADGSPHLTVLWYDPEGDDTIMFNTARGRLKDRNLRRDDRAAFCVEDGARYVTLTGRCAIEDTDHATIMADVLRLGIRYLGEEAGRALADKLQDDPRESIRLTIATVDAHGF